MDKCISNIKSFQNFKEDIEIFKHPKLFLVDIKSFEAIGYQYGDRASLFIKQSLSAILCEYAKTNDMQAYNAKGDNFILVKNVHFDLSQMEKIIFSLTDKLNEKTFYFENNPITISVRIGICFDHTNAFEKAQKALELAKVEDLPFATYSEFAIRLLDENEDKIEHMIKDAISNKHIVPLFQPVKNKDLQIIYYESLVRLKGNQILQSPKLFLKIARERNCYDILLENICENIIKTISNNEETISLNISYEDLLVEKRVDFLSSFSKGRKIIFEILCPQENIPENICHTIQEFKKKAGAQIALDNVEEPQFLKNFDGFCIDYVKIHGDIIRDAQEEPQKYELCKTLLKNCNDIGAKAIATHINSQNTYDNAKNIGFELFQGFFIQTPSPRLPI
ncbi:MAG: EAL domain-containing protein [Sulfurospirillaceae bacterium]|nr:EAL domain-containing protein [Sulfurospirillaceae bacterium]MDD3462501.1 EAL domain-containing protein [Sulfurospirillaceae bacterium]